MSKTPIGTPAAAISTSPEISEVDLTAEGLENEDMVIVKLLSSQISGKLMLEPEPARQLADDLLEAAAEAEIPE